MTTAGAARLNCVLSAKVSRAPVAAVLMFSLVTGCTSGRIAAVRVLEGGIVIQDAHYQNSAVVTGGRVVRVPGTLVPQTGAGRWAVCEETTPRLRSVRSSRGNNRRLPAWADEIRLRACDAQDGRVYDIPDFFQSDDAAFRDLLVVDDRIMAIIRDWYLVDSRADDDRYYEYKLPDGPWNPLPVNQGRDIFRRHRAPQKIAFQDLRHDRPTSRPAGGAGGGRAGREAETVGETPTSRVFQGDWGEVVERQKFGGWEVVFKPPQGGEIPVFGSNDLGVGSTAGLVPQKPRAVGP